MTGCAPKWRLFLFLLLGFHLAGCSQMRRGSQDEEKEPYFIDGRNRAGRYDWNGAIHSFERAVQVNPNNASAHLELAVIYDTQKHDYISALYHYQRHLLLRTNSPIANVVQEKMNGCARELAKPISFSVLPRDIQRDLARYEETNSFYKKRIQLLEAELARGPQIITNYVTNFVGLPQTASRSSSRLTQPTEPLAAAEDDPEPVQKEPAPAASRETRSSAPKQTALRSSPAPSKSRVSPSSRHEASARAVKPEPASSGARTTHQVRPGETLAALAARYGVSVQSLRAANPAAAHGVHAGQRIIIPK